MISGKHVGPVPRHERAATLGAGALAYVIWRLTLLAGYWLPVVTTDPTRMLFKLIAEGWRHASTSRLGGGLDVHRTSFALLTASDPAPIDSSSPPTDRRAQQLVNLYPIPAHELAHSE